MLLAYTETDEMKFTRDDKVGECRIFNKSENYL